MQIGVKQTAHKFSVYSLSDVAVWVGELDVEIDSISICA